MKQKTPIQKALERVNYHETSTRSLMNRETLRRLRITLEDLLQEEENVIRQAFIDGKAYAGSKLPFYDELYFLQNFDRIDYDKSEGESL